jgi:hypothetical protein
MVYFLGKDVTVHWTTEASGLSLSGSISNTGDSMSAVKGADSNDTGILVLERIDGIHSSTLLSDITGVDFAPGAVNEDISFMGKNTNLSAQVKHEFSLSVTKKKNDTVWDQMYNQRGRDGVYTTSGTAGNIIEENPITGITDFSTAGYTGNVHDGLTTSRINTFGYRLYITIKEGDEVFVLRNCCMTGHTVTLNADGTQEETAEFYSYVDPLIVASASAGGAQTVTSGTTMAEI